MEPSALVLHSPDAAIAAVPYLLGFHPRESAVLLWCGADGLELTQRIDLPDPDQRSAWLEAAWGHAAARPGHALLAILVTDHEVPEGLVEALLERADRAGTPLRDVLATDGRTWRSLLCATTDCCPVPGRPVDPGIATRVAAEFVARGRAPLPDRDDLVREFDAAPELQAAVTGCVAPAPAGRAARECWRDAQIAAIVGLAGRAGPATPAELARVVAGLADVRVRDTVLWELAQGEDILAAGLVLAAAVRGAPDGWVAPVATCAAIVAWCRGDGARARAALDRARGDDPRYSLALLIEQAVAGGLPPSAWRDSLRGLTREDCRRAA